MSVGAKFKLATKTRETKRENSASQTNKLNFSPSINSPIDQILFLQRTVGNQAVEKLLKSGVIQAKLIIGQPGDIYEQEADRVAEQVMLIKEGSLDEGRGEAFFKPSFTIQNGIQRQEKEPEPEEQKETLQTLPHEFDLRLDWFEMSRPFFTRGAENMLYFDDRMYLSIGNVWTHNYDFFFNFGLGDKLSADAANFFTPFTLDSALKRDFPTSSELFERNADITSFVLSPTLFNFDIHDIPGTLRFPFLKIFGVEQPNPYAPVQRKCAECEQEEELQRKEESHLSIPAQATPFGHSTEKRKTSNLAQYILSLGYGGQSLPPSVRAFFEPRFGQDFSGVRLHTDSRANESAKSVNALAYTVRQDVVFGEGQYSPETESGKKLIAHELTHVVQQKSARKMSLSGITTSSSKRVYDCLQRAVRSVSCQNPSGRVREIVGDNPLGTVQAADARAIALLDNAIGELVRTQEQIRSGDEAAWPAISDALAWSLRDRLGIDPENRELWTSRQRLTPRGVPTIALLLFRLNRVRETLAGGQIRYRCLDRPPCPPMSEPDEVVLGGGLAFAEQEQFRIILCEGFWRDDNVDNHALTLVHEAFHLYFGAPEHSGRNMWNPYCIELFVYDSSGATIPEGLERCCAPGAAVCSLF
jgi:hypothetical protein